MSGIRARHTRPELAVKKALSQAGFRYGQQSKKLPGRPDFALSRVRCAIFVHGCFWHRHPGCKYAYTPKSNVKFWLDKFDANLRRDKAVRKALRSAGWRVLTIWECRVNERGLARLIRSLKGGPK
jgi:DNA mismatch endonuclease (patch repair protein)